MKVGIMGAGSMGSLFGGLIAEAGHEVWLVDVWREQVDAVNEHGLRMTCEGRERYARPRATTDPAEPGPMDLVMFWCKGPATPTAVADAAPMLGETTIACTLQNGLGNREVIGRAVPPGRLLHGVTEIGATIQSPGHIELTPAAWEGGGATYVGTSAVGDFGQAERVAELLNGAGIATTARRDVDMVIWGKLVVACPIAPAVAIARLPIGLITGFEDMGPLLGGLCDEVVAVANASGIPLDADRSREHAFAVWHSVGNHVSSMGGDVLARRPTEVESISGAIVRQGEKVGVPTPLNAVMARLVRLVEAHYDQQLGVA
jgi:2-dehydropantoate 2-reductase